MNTSLKEHPGEMTVFPRPIPGLRIRNQENECENKNLRTLAPTIKTGALWIFYCTLFVSCFLFFLQPQRAKGSWRIFFSPAISFLARLFDYEILSVSSFFCCCLFSVSLDERVNWLEDVGCRLLFSCENRKKSSLSRYDGVCLPFILSKDFVFILLGFCVVSLDK